MKRIGVLCVLLVFLTGCSNTPKEIERGMALRSKLLQASSCSFDTEITADYGDQIHCFSMCCEADGQGDLSFMVTAPETISGITGTISGEGGKLTFDDVALNFDLMADDQLTPVSAPWIFLRTLRSGYLTSACEEDGGIRLTLDDSFDDDALQVDIWLNGDDLPERAEILHNGRRILTLNVKNFGIA